MAKVLGLGGVFWKCNDSKKLIAWYRDVLGVSPESWGGVIFRPQALAAQPGAATVFSPFGDTSHFAPSEKTFMFNLVVDDLDGVLARCKEHGVAPLKDITDDDHGRFASIMDPEGTKLELWQPKGP